MVFNPLAQAQFLVPDSGSLDKCYYSLDQSFDGSLKLMHSPSPGSTYSWDLNCWAGPHIHPGLTQVYLQNSAVKIFLDGMGSSESE